MSQSSFSRRKSLVNDIFGTNATVARSLESKQMKPRKLEFLPPSFVDVSLERAYFDEIGFASYATFIRTVKSQWHTSHGTHDNQNPRFPVVGRKLLDGSLHLSAPLPNKEWVYIILPSDQWKILPYEIYGPMLEKSLRDTPHH